MAAGRPGLAAVLAAAAVSAVACSSPPVVPAPTPRTTAGGPAPASATPTAAAPTVAAGAASLDRCPAPRSLGALPVLARPPLRPDDLLAVPGGGLWVSDPDGGHLARLDAAGHALTVIDDPRGPDGMVALGDGRLVLAEQKPNRLVTLRPPAPAVTVLADLPPAGGRLGVDGIALDAARRRLLVPDSAAGALRALPLDGGPLVTLATGLGRPVGAVAAPDGSVYVVAEVVAGLRRIGPDGAVSTVGRLGDLDDVVTAGGLLYVTALGGRSVLAVDPATGGDRVLATGLGEPQGLAVLPDGRLAAADSTSGLIVAVDPCQ
jgi:sugar lactone lactonase YvrE